MNTDYGKYIDVKSKYSLQEWLVIISIVFSSVMIAGYAVVEELIVGVIVASLILSRRLSTTDLSLPSINRVHYLLFSIFILYQLFQSFRGMLVLEDIRMLRFILLFPLLWFVSVIFTSKCTDYKQVNRMAYVVLIAGGIYFVCYLLLGLGMESIFAINRFDMQGWIWGGTSASIVPAFLMLPALVVVLNEPDTGLSKRLAAFLVFSLLCLIAFYFQSRALWLSLLAFCIICLYSTGWRKALLLLIIYTVIMLAVPWTSSGLMTGKDSNGSISQQTTVSSIVQGLKEKFVRFTFVSGGGAISRALGQQIYHTQTQGNAVELRSNTVAGDDIDRVLATRATINHLYTSTPFNQLFGYGFYTHRYVLIPVFKQAAEEAEYSWPESYNTIVRTATFNGMLADGGIVGLLLLFSLYAIVLYRALIEPVRQRPIIIISTCFLMLWTLISSSYDMMLFYFALMPNGPMMALLGRRSSTAPT